MTDFLPDRSRKAKTALFDVGFELAGVRLQVFAERLLAAAEASPDVSVDQLAQATMEAIEGGPLALVAEEPALAHYRLAEPAGSASEAAEAALRCLAQRLVTASRGR